MLYKDGFLKQWDEFQKILGVRIKKEFDENGDFSTKTANKILLNEKKQWTSPSQYYGIWLNKLKKYNETIGIAFEQKLGDIIFHDIKFSSGNSNAIFYVLLPIIIGVIAYVLTSALNLANWKIIGSTAILLILASRTSYSILENKKADKKLQCRDMYIQQLEPYKVELLKLCEEADENRG